MNYSRDFYPYWYCVLALAVFSFPFIIWSLAACLDAKRRLGRPRLNLQWEYRIAAMLFTVGSTLIATTYTVIIGNADIDPWKPLIWTIGAFTSNAAAFTWIQRRLTRNRTLAGHGTMVQNFDGSSELDQLDP